MRNFFGFLFLWSFGFLSEIRHPKDWPATWPAILLSGCELGGLTFCLYHGNNTFTGFAVFIYLVTGLLCWVFDKAVEHANG